MTTHAGYLVVRGFIGADDEGVPLTLFVADFGLAGTESVDDFAKRWPFETLAIRCRYGDRKMGRSISVGRSLRIL